MTQFPIVLGTVQTAVKLLSQATHHAPAASNLRDELEALTEQTLRVQNAIAANAYNLAGMEA
jgi:FixJ family two-component response regulator